MERISLFIRTAKKEGTIRLRFRLTDGRSADLYHKSEIKADLSDLNKFDVKTGRAKDRTRIYNQELEADIQTEMSAMHTAYCRLRQSITTPITAEMFEAEIERVKNPDKYETHISETLLQRFSRHVEEGHRDGIFAARRYAAYKVVETHLTRYTTIRGIRDIRPVEFGAEKILDFRQFLFNEYQFVEDWPGLYLPSQEHNTQTTHTGSKAPKHRNPNTPTERRSQNSVATKMKMVQAFFATLEDSGEIDKNPFRLLGKERKHVILRETYDTPISLTLHEVEAIQNAEIPASLEETRDAFLLQCALGCRIGDYNRMKADSVAVTEAGVPYIHYLPEKTLNTRKNNSELCTPLVKFAFDIVKRRGLDFSIIRYASGEKGYNKKIKDLLRVCGINREVLIYDEEKRANTRVNLYDVASSKLARKTNVELCKGCQINLYAAGLHKAGSTAVNHYTELSLWDKFVLLSSAFNQPLFKADSNLNEI